MNRNHKVEKYLEIYKLIKKINNNVEFSSDFIVGYPGEENDDFDQTNQKNNSDLDDEIPF